MGKMMAGEITIFHAGNSVRMLLSLRKIEEFTIFFFDSGEVVGDLNLANNSRINVLSSFNKETT
jgi:hypothetical protein